MQAVRCPFCFVLLDARHLPAHRVFPCPGCSKPIRIAEPLRIDVRPYLLGGVMLGLMLGVTLTLLTGRLLRSSPSVPAAATELTASPPPTGMAAAEPVTEKADDLGIGVVQGNFRRLVDEADARLRREFGTGSFRIFPSYPWLIALEIGGSYSERETLEQYERVLKSFHEAFRNEFSLMNLPPIGRPLTIVIFSGRYTFDDYCRLTGGRTMPPFVKGFYEENKERTITYVEGDATLEKMLHEGAHQIVHYYMFRRPFQTFWFHEGLAGIFETFRRERQGGYEWFVVSPQVNPTRLFQARQAFDDPELRSYVKLSQVLGMTMISYNRWQRAIANELPHDGEQALRKEVKLDRIANAYYAVSWGLVYFMVRSQPEYLRVLADYFSKERIGDGGLDTFERLLEAHAGETLDQFQDKFRRFLQQLQ